MTLASVPERQAEDARRAPCRICGSTEGRRIQALGYSWLRCGRCASVQKILTAEEYRALDPSYDPGTFLNSSSDAELLRVLAVDHKAALIERMLTRWWRGDRAKASFMDVGCGMGGYLMGARKLGMDVLGFEPSESHSTVARQRLGLPVITDYFSAAKVGARKFDFIMLSHVIEHIYEPATFVHELLSVLRPGGVLLIITPNTRSYIAQLAGRAWPMLKPVDHVSLISSRAYAHFALPPGVSVHHEYSEYPYEFAATFASIAKDRLRRAPAGAAVKTPSANTADTGVTQLKRRMPLVLGALSVASFPMHAMARLTGRQACLVSVLVKDRA